MNVHRIILLFVLVVFINCQSQNKTIITKIDKEYLFENVIGKDAQLIDVRTAEEYEIGKIDDAINFDVNQSNSFLQQIKALDKSKPVYVYCKVGGRSNRAAKILNKEGFTQIFDYSGGYNDWVSN
jgi:rhodanese-related sulfurtransferase